MTVTGQNTSLLSPARRVRPRRISRYQEHGLLNYTTEILGRSTGDLKDVSLGDWITITELGERYGVGSKKIRSILHHLGLLQSKGKHGRYRLTPHAVELELGKRIDKPKKSKWPFDVISPEGQRLIAAVWDETVADLERERLSDPIVHTADAALQTFKAQRASSLETQQEVCWLLDHFDTLTFQQIADLLGVQRPLVSRYASLQKEQREFHSRRMACV
jgi:predicted XRE-type DNA-binding protein